MSDFAATQCLRELRCLAAYGVASQRWSAFTRYAVLERIIDHARETLWAVTEGRENEPLPELIRECVVVAQQALALRRSSTFAVPNALRDLASKIDAAVPDPDPLPESAALDLLPAPFGRARRSPFAPA